MDPNAMRSPFIGQSFREHCDAAFTHAIACHANATLVPQQTRYIYDAVLDATRLSKVPTSERDGWIISNTIKRHWRNDFAPFLVHTKKG